jgi:carboxyl-terminal processing protease
VAVPFILSFGRSVDAGAANPAETYKELKLFGDAFEKVRRDYVDEVSDNALIEGAIKGMLTSLDPHSGYMSAGALDELNKETRGVFGGFGIEGSMENGLLKVISPIDDTPAARAGVKPGDIITDLDGRPVQGMTLLQISKKMRGPEKSQVTLTIQRGNRAPFDVKLARATIEIQPVRSHLEGDSIGYIRITSFNEQTDVRLENAMNNLKQLAGNKLAGLVLDLRNNPGGLLDQAVAVSDAFLDKGEIVSTRGRRSDDTQRYNAHPGDITGGLPMVVLINSGSASASEIVAGALKDHHRALLMGTRSFGKGSVQTIIPLPGHGAMRLTTARYYTPSGQSIQAKGIVPDIYVEAAKIEHPAADASAVAKKTDESKTDPDSASDEATVDPTVIGTPDDYQLARAVDMLRGIALLNLGAEN